LPAARRYRILAETLGMSQDDGKPGNLTRSGQRAACERRHIDPYRDSLFASVVDLDAEDGLALS